MTTIRSSFWGPLMVALLLTSCAAPRVINQSGKVTNKGNLVIGATASYNYSGQAARALGNVVLESLPNLTNQDSIRADGLLRTINRAAVAQAIDPLSGGYDFYARYGLIHGLEISYKKAGRANVFGTQFQFLGNTGSYEQITASRIHGSVGVYYGSQSYKLPGIIADMQSVFGYQFKRRDLVIPLIISRSLGNQEEFGSIACGMVYSRTRIEYAWVPDKIYDGNGIPLQAGKERQVFSSYGFFFNAKLGYRHVFVIPALSIFHQNYGTYRLLDGGTTALKGWSVVPSISLQFQLGKVEGREGKK